MAPGAGGQHRNKTQNCCRITHIETGLTATGQRSRERSTNQSEAFKVLVGRLLAHYMLPDERRVGGEVIRTYHAERNQVVDKASGHKQEYKTVVIDGDLTEMIKARRQTHAV